MEDKKNKKQTKVKSRTQKEGMEEETFAGDVEARVVLTPVKCRSRAGSDCSSIVEEAPKPRAAAKESRRNSVESVRIDKLETPGSGSLEAVAKERKELEKFLFEESNKINRVAIKFILEKWAAMETRLQNCIMENEVLKEKCRNVGKMQQAAPSYAQAAARRAQGQCPSGPTEVKKNSPSPRENFEVVLIKPKGEDKRNNEQIKDEILKELEKVRKNLKVRNVRQMRKQGLVVEVMDQSEVETIGSCELDKIGFSVERPKKIDPSIIIHDVERDYKERTWLKRTSNVTPTTRYTKS